LNPIEQTDVPHRLQIRLCGGFGWRQPSFDWAFEKIKKNSGVSIVLVWNNIDQLPSFTP